MKPIIVMPHYIKNPELEQLAINAICSLRSADVFVLSIDDGSPLDTTFLEYISDEVLRLPENSGFAKACNVGLKWAIEHEYDYIGCANNDIEVYGGWLDALRYPFKKWHDTGITGLISSKERYPEGVPIFQYKVPKITEGGLLNRWMQSGGLWLTRRPILEKVGIFDEQFETGGVEDIDLFWRIRDAGYKLVMSGHSAFWHKEGATRWSPDTKEKNKKIEEENYRKFAEKWNWDIWADGHGLNFSETILEEK